MACNIDYRRDVSLCMRVWKETIKKENNEKELKDLLLDVAVCFMLSFLKNKSH